MPSIRNSHLALLLVFAEGFSAVFGKAMSPKRGSVGVRARISTNNGAIVGGITSKAICRRILSRASKIIMSKVLT